MLVPYWCSARESTPDITLTGSAYHAGQEAWLLACPKALYVRRFGKVGGLVAETVTALIPGIVLAQF